MEDRQEGAEASASVIASETGEQYVVFKLGHEEYAAPILDIQEIIPAGDITPFPNAPAYVSGIINVRGTVATVVSLAKLFGLTKENGEGEGYIILVKTEKTLFGVQVDTVSSVMNIGADAIRSADGVNHAAISAEYIKGIAVVGERVILILNLHRVLNEEDEKAGVAEVPSDTSAAS